MTETILTATQLPPDLQQGQVELLKSLVAACHNAFHLLAVFSQAHAHITKVGEAGNALEQILGQQMQGNTTLACSTLKYTSGSLKISGESLDASTQRVHDHWKDQDH